MTGRNRELEVTFRGSVHSGRIAVAPIRRSRTKLIAAIIGVALALGPGLFAAWHYTERANSNTGRDPIQPASNSEQISILPGTALTERDGEEQPASSEEDDGSIGIDLGEITGGESAVYPDLFRVRNDGAQDVLVFVETVGISEAPLHASTSGEEGPGAFRIAPGEEQPVDLGLASDIAATPGDVVGSLLVRTGSGLTEKTLPTLATIVPPPVEDLIATLLGAAANAEAGLGRIGESTEGMEAPDFVVNGVSQGGVYGSDVTISWYPVGPLSRTVATLNGSPISSEHTVTPEGDYTLHLEGYVLDSSLFAKDLTFRIDRTPPETVLVSSPIQSSAGSRFAVDAADDSGINGVDLILLRRDAQEESSSPSPTPAPSPSATPAPTATPAPSATPQTTPTPAPTFTPSPSPTPEPSEDPATQTTRIRAKHDPATGLWIVDTVLEPGTYEVYAEARDAAGNIGPSSSQMVRVLGASSVSDSADGLL